MSSSELNVLPLASFIRCYGQHLPLRVRVEEGFYGNDEGSVISSGDLYNFHFIRNEKRMCIEDSTGARFSVPFNSSISFGLIYNPFNEPLTTIRRYSFTSVGEIITSKYPPPIIRATIEFKCRDPKSSVVKDEILIVKRINQNRKKKKECITVHSLLTGDEKVLYRQCEGNFLTDPGSVRVYLPEIAKFFEKSLPILAKIYLNSDVTDDSISHLALKVVKMTHISTESEIIATSWSSESDGNEVCQPLAIPFDLKIEVSTIEPPSGNNEDLYQKTRELFERFHLSEIKDMKHSRLATSDSTKHLQRKLKGPVRKGYERQGVIIERPTRAYSQQFRSTHAERKAEEVDQLGAQNDDNNIFRERRAPSITYSTFISDHRMSPISKQRWNDEPNFSDDSLLPLDRPSSSPKQAKSNSSGATSTFSTDKSVSVSQTKIASESTERLKGSLHTCIPGKQVAAQPATHSLKHSMYDIPKKLTSQTLDVSQACMRTFGADLQLETGERLKPIAVSPCISPCHQSTSYKPCLPAVQHVENISLPSHSTSIETETVYNVPRLVAQIGMTHPRQKVIGDCDPLINDTSRLSLMQTRNLKAAAKTSPADTSFADLGRTDSTSIASERTKPLSELIKDHPLLKLYQQEVNDSLPSKKTQSQSCGNSSSSSSLSYNGSSLAPGPLKNNPKCSVSGMLQSHVGDKAQRQEYSSNPLLNISNPARKHRNASIHQRQNVKHSQVVSASSNRAQTLIARNIQELKQLNCEQMLTLLDNMNLSQYKQCFLCEEIDGEILSECDENVLLYELNVCSQSHRDQLMNIITGKQSVTLLLSDQGRHDYVRLRKKKQYIN